MKELWLDRRKARLILLSSLFFLLAAHLYRWVNTMYSHDSLLIIQDDWVWQISLGRIFNPLYVRLRGNILAPMNVALFSSAFLILSAALVVRILRLEKTASIIMCCGFLITFETIAYVNGMFLHSLDLDMLALLFSVLAAYFLTGKANFWRYAAGVLCVTASLGLFQTYIEVTIMLICLELLREVLEGGDPKKLFFKGLRCSGMLILGGVLYYICLKTVLKVTGIAPAETYNGLVQMKTLTLPAMLSLAKDAWISTLRYLFSDSLIAHRSISRWVYRLLGLSSLFIIVRTAVKKRLRFGASALVVFLLLAMPLGGNSVYVLSQGLKHNIMTYSFVFFSVLFVMAFDMLETDGGAALWLQRAIPLLCAVLLLNHVLFANQWYIRNDLYSRAGMSFMTRLVSDMEEAEGYEVGKTPVLILGCIDENPSAAVDERFEIVGDGMRHRFAVSYYQTYDHFFRYILGYSVNLVPLREVGAYLDDPQIRAMAVYPAPGSVQMIRGVLVVRLSRDLRPEEYRYNISSD